MPFAAILVNCAPSGEMHNSCTPHIMKEYFENFLIHRCKTVYSYLKCIVYDKLLKPRQSFLITLYNTEHEPCVLHNKVHKKSLKLIKTNSFSTATAVMRTNFDFTFISKLANFYSLNRDLNQDSVTSCLRYQLIQFPPHEHMFGKTGFKPLNVLNINK